MRPNPKRPAKPLRIVAHDGHRASSFALLAYDGRTRVGGAELFRTHDTDSGDAKGRAILTRLGAVAGYYVYNISLAEAYRGKGYGSQLYATAFAECVRREGGPVVIGAAAAMTSYVATSALARGVWARMSSDYLSDESKLAVVMRPEDVKAWMLPKKHVDIHGQEYTP